MTTKRIKMILAQHNTQYHEADGILYAHERWSVRDQNGVTTWGTDYVPLTGYTLRQLMLWLGY
jgi:hypothetical protein